MSPECPCCGGTDARLLQRIPAPLLRRLWQVAGGFAPAQLRESPSLFQCDCGLLFFSPAQAGDAGFYRNLYAHPLWAAWLHAPADQHADFLAAAAHIGATDRVLDVGGHAGTFATLLPAGSHTEVLDPHAGEYGVAGVLRETAAEHAAHSPEAYDAVCAFQVIEHVEAPLDLARDMLACLRPGGLLMFAAPTWPSRLTAIPNMVMNAPPHHLHLWSPAAFECLAQRLGIKVVEARVLRSTRGLNDNFYWLERLTPTASVERMFAHDWGTHARLFAAFKLHRLLNRLFGSGPLTNGIDAFLVARKP